MSLKSGQTRPDGREGPVLDSQEPPPSTPRSPSPCEDTVLSAEDGVALLEALRGDGADPRNIFSQEQMGELTVARGDSYSEGTDSERERRDPHPSLASDGDPGSPGIDVCRLENSPFQPSPEARQGAVREAAVPVIHLARSSAIRTDGFSSEPGTWRVRPAYGGDSDAIPPEIIDFLRSASNGGVTEGDQIVPAHPTAAVAPVVQAPRRGPSPGIRSNVNGPSDLQGPSMRHGRYVYGPSSDLGWGPRLRFLVPDTLGQVTRNRFGPLREVTINEVNHPYTWWDLTYAEMGPNMYHNSENWDWTFRGVARAPWMLEQSISLDYLPYDRVPTRANIARCAVWIYLHCVGYWARVACINASGRCVEEYILWDERACRATWRLEREMLHY